MLFRPLEVHRTGPRSNFLSANNLLHQGPHMDAGCHKGNCLPRRGLCAIPPRFFLPHCLPSSCISGGRRGLPLHVLADMSPVSPGNPAHHPQLPHKPAPLHRKVKSPGSAVSGECGRRKGQVSPPAPPLPPWKTTLPTLPLLPTQP